MSFRLGVDVGGTFTDLLLINDDRWLTYPWGVNGGDLVIFSTEGARRYGAVFNIGGQVDEAATRTLRQELASSRNTGELFSRGGTIEEIKARCEAETGLPAPATPTWTHRGAI
jgi:hypothetical protein